MKKTRYALACGFAATLLALPARAQLDWPGTDKYIDEAKGAALFDYTGLFASQCVSARFPHPGNWGTDPGREKWYAEPEKVFDNLYFLGTRFHTSWAVDTGDGIVLIDSLYNYAVEPEVVEGMKKMGLDPAKVKYMFITHGHSDHDQGATLFQTRYGTRVVMGAADWDTIEKGKPMPGGTPRRDLDAVDGQKITVGDTTFTFIATPGHTAGDYGLTFDVKENGKPVSVAYASGTAMRFNKEFFPVFINSLEKMSAAAKAANATVLLSNHSAFDNAWTLARLAAWRPAGTPNPFEIGQERVQKYFTVMLGCARAGQVWMDDQIEK